MIADPLDIGEGFLWGCTTHILFAQWGNNSVTGFPTEDSHVADA